MLVHSCTVAGLLTRSAVIYSRVMLHKQMHGRCTMYVQAAWSAHDVPLVLVQVRMVHLSKSTNASISTKDPMAVPLPIGMGNHGCPVIGAQCCVLLQRTSKTSAPYHNAMLLTNTCASSFQ
jgi:hypothetical protein